MKQNNFTVSKEDVYDQRRNYPLIPDLKQGFKLARRNGQIHLALEYLDLMLDIIDEKMCTCDHTSTKTDKPVRGVSKKTEEVLEVGNNS